MSGKSPNDAARVAPQHDAPEMIVPIIPPTIPVLALPPISERFQYL